MSIAISEAIEKSDELDKKINEFFQQVNDALDYIPEFLQHLVQQIIDGLHKLQQKCEELWNKAKEFFDNTGNPAKLDRYAEEWHTIGEHIGDIGSSVGLERLDTNTEWTGSGAAAYKAVVPPQGDGLKNIQSVTNELNTTLKDLANGIEDFWLQFSIALGSAVIGMGAAVLQALTVIDIPGAIITALAAVGVAFGFLTTSIVTLKNMYDKFDMSKTNIENKLSTISEEWTKPTKSNRNKMGSPGQWDPM